MTNNPLFFEHFFWIKRAVKAVKVAYEKLKLCTGQTLYKSKFEKIGGNTVIHVTVNLKILYSKQIFRSLEFVVRYTYANWNIR